MGDADAVGKWPGMCGLRDRQRMAGITRMALAVQAEMPMLEEDKFASVNALDRDDPKESRQALTLPCGPVGRWLRYRPRSLQWLLQRSRSIALTSCEECDTRFM